jgi:flagellar L-ring protein precursor FlgH
MVRFPLFVTFLCAACATASFAQTEPPPTPTAKTGSSTRERPSMSMSMAAQATAAHNSSSLMTTNGGSLLRASLVAAQDPARAGLKNVSVFSVPDPEPKTVKKHDLITIIIREESEVSSQGTSDLKRQSDIDAKVDSFSRLNLANFALQPSVGSVAPELKASGTRNFKGEATVDRTDSVIMRVTGEVVDVKPNGTLVLQARKKIKNDEEEQTLVCSGICRVEDLTPDNTVLSTQLFDLEFSKTNKGQVRNTTKTGFVHKLLDFVNPF